MKMMGDYIKAVLNRWKELSLGAIDVVGYLTFVVFEVGKDGADLPEFFYWDWPYIIIGLLSFGIANFQVYKNLANTISGLENEINDIKYRASNLEVFFYEDNVATENITLSLQPILGFDISEILKKKKRELIDAYNAEVGRSEKEDKIELQNRLEISIAQAFLGLKDEKTYMKDVESFLEELHNYYYKIYLIELKRARIRKFKIILKNSGHATAKTIKIILSFPDDVKIVKDELIDEIYDLEMRNSLLASAPRPPAPPSLTKQFSAGFETMISLNPYSPITDFELSLDEPKRIISDSIIEYSIDNLVQGYDHSDFEVIDFIIPFDSDTGSKTITYEIFAEDIVDPPKEGVLTLEIVEEESNK